MNDANDLNDLNNLSKFDQEMLEAIDKIAARQLHSAPSAPASDLYSLGNYLANIEVPARPAFRQQLEAALLSELTAPMPTTNEFISGDYAQPVLPTISPTKNRRPAFRLQFPGWRKLLLVGMVATILLLVGLIRFAVITTDPLDPTPGAAIQPVQTVPPTSTLVISTLAPTVIIAPTATPVPIAPATVTTAPAPAPGVAAQNYKIELKIANQSVTQRQLDAARQIIEQRLKGLQLGQVRILAFDAQAIRLEVYGVADIAQLLELLRSPGRLEVINSDDQRLVEGEQVYTSGWLEWAANNNIPGKERVAQNPAKVFETVLANEQLELARGLPEQTINRANGATILYARLKTDSIGVLVKYSRASSIKQFTVVQDSKVLNTFSVNPEVSDRIQITSNSWNTPQSKNAITNLTLMLQSGVLPLELSVQSSQPF